MTTVSRSAAVVCLLGAVLTGGCGSAGTAKATLHPTPPSLGRLACIILQLIAQNALYPRSLDFKERRNKDGKAYS